MFRDTIINIVKFGTGEINNQLPFTLLMVFGNFPKSVNVGHQGRSSCHRDLLLDD